MFTVVYSSGPGATDRVMAQVYDIDRAVAICNGLITHPQDASAVITDAGTYVYETYGTWWADADEAACVYSI